MRTLMMATVAIVGLAATANASVTTFTTSATFNAASSNVTNYSFPISTPDGTIEPSPFTFGPLSFSDTFLSLNNDSSYGGREYLSAYDQPSSGANFSITTSGAPTAISFNLDTFNPVETVSVAVNGATVATIPGTTGAPATTFLGFTDTSPITSIVFTNVTTPGDEIDILNFATGSASSPAAVTEPASLALLSVGIFLLGITRWRARRGTARIRGQGSSVRQTFS